MAYPDLRSESMTPERWQAVQDLFNRALERGADERRAFLGEACAADSAMRRQVEALLKAHRAAGRLFDRPALRLVSRDPAGAGDPPPSSPWRIGEYNVMELLGHGGMGSVYSAVRADGVYRQRVAIKVLRRGLDTEDLATRFRVERQILASLSHPHIARLLDGGSTDDGRPYLVMEYVRGQPIHRYCDDNGLTVPQRVALFREVCGAVQFAHQNLIVHRDLKPTNILVTTDGEPKLLDFGVAKLLNPRQFPLTTPPTELGRAPMTPEYASPEQVRGEVITTASDVYSLGLVLYEMLTGRPAHRITSREMREVERVVCHENPEAPSIAFAKLPLEERQSRGLARRSDPRRLARALRGDLDNIVLMALRKEPSRRYASAEQFSEDLGNYLDGRPVVAHRDSLAYRAGKFARRHKVGVTAAILGLTSLLGLTSTLLIQRQLHRQRQWATAVTTLLGDVAELSDPARPRGEELISRRFLERAADLVDNSLRGKAQVEPKLRIARAFINLGLYGEAEEHLESALARNSPSGAGGDALTAENLLLLAEVHKYQAAYEEAESFARQSLAMYRGRFGDHHEGTLRAKLELARIHDLRGDFQRSAGEFLQILELARTPELKAVRARGLEHYATLLEHRGDLAQAIARMRQATTLYRESRGETHPDIAVALNNLALLENERDPRAALALLREAETSQRRLYENGHPYLAATLNNQGLVLHQLGRYDDAHSRYLEALAMQRRHQPGDRRLTASIVNNLAQLEFARGNLEAAREQHLQALEMYRAILGPRHPETAISLNNLARVLAARGEYEEAESQYRAALAILRRVYADHGHPRLATVLNNLAELAHGRGHLEQAAPLYERALATMRASLGEAHPNVALLLHNLASLREQQGDPRQAETAYREALGILRRHYGDRHPQVASLMIRLADLKHRAGDPAAALPLARGALDILADPNPEDAWSLAARRILGSSLLALGHYGEAEPLLRDRYEWLKEHRGPRQAATLEALRSLVELYEHWQRPEQAARFRRLIP